MIGIVETIETQDGRKLVALEDYQNLMKKYEKLNPPLSTKEILANAGEDEVYNE